jgi:hypothetical protein
VRRGYYGLHRLGVSYAAALALICAIVAAADVLLLRRLFGKASGQYILQEVEK